MSYCNIRPYSCDPPLDLPSHILIIVIDLENNDSLKALIRMSTFTDSARKWTRNEGWLKYNKTRINVADLVNMNTGWS